LRSAIAAKFFPQDFAYYFRRLCHIEIRQSEKRTRMASSNGRGASASGQATLPAVRFLLKIYIDPKACSRSNPFII
jgi:hypothetical protein